MQRWSRYCWSKIASLFPAKHSLRNITSFSYETRGRKHRSVNLYKVVESCSGYEDIQVMWEMLHTSCPPDSKSRKDQIKLSKPRVCGNWRYCFRPA